MKNTRKNVKNTVQTPIVPPTPSVEPPKKVKKIFKEADLPNIDLGVKNDVCSKQQVVKPNVPSQQIVNVQGFERELEDAKLTEITSPEAMIMIAKYKPIAIDYSITYHYDERPELMTLMKAFKAYCTVSPNCTTVIPKMMSHMKELKNHQFPDTHIDELIETPLDTRRIAMGIVPSNKAIYVNEYNIAKIYFEKGYRLVTFESNVIVFHTPKGKYPIAKDKFGLWNMKPITGTAMCAEFGKEYKWHGKSNGEVHMCFYLSLVCDLSVVSGIFEFQRKMVNNPIFNQMSRQELDVVRRLHDYAFEFPHEALSSVPFVTLGSHNTILSVMIEHFPPLERNYDKYFTAMQGLQKMWPQQPTFIKDLTTFIATMEGKDLAQKQKVIDIMTDGADKDKIATELVHSRTFRGAEKSTANTILKDVVDNGPPLPDFSTYAKWRIATDDMEDIDDDRLKVACIGCTSKNDWWSNVLDADIDRYDIKMTTGVDYLDIKSANLNIGPHDVIMSDVYLPKPVGKGVGAVNAAADFNAQSIVPEQVWKIQEITNAKIVLMKCFPQRAIESMGSWSFSHLKIEEHKDWYMTILLNGRNHNGEFIAYFSKSITRDGLFQCRQFTRQRQECFMSYLFGIMHRCNKFRNLSLLYLSNKWEVKPIAKLDRLPKGEIQKLVEELKAVPDEEYVPIPYEKRRGKTNEEPSSSSSSNENVNSTPAHVIEMANEDAFDHERLDDFEYIEAFLQKVINDSTYDWLRLEYEKFFSEEENEEQESGDEEYCEQEDGNEEGCNDEDGEEEKEEKLVVPPKVATKGSILNVVSDKKNRIKKLKG